MNSLIDLLQLYVLLMAFRTASLLLLIDPQVKLFSRKLNNDSEEEEKEQGCAYVQT